MNAIMFGAAVSACDKAQKWQESLLLLDTMAQYKLVPDSIAATAALSSCAGAGQWELALDFFRQLCLWEMTIDEVMYSCCIKACAKGAQAERSFQLLLAMLDCNVMPNEICYTVACHSFWKRNGLTDSGLVCLPHTTIRFHIFHAFLQRGIWRSTWRCRQVGQWQ